jgi:hypothetical protein
MTASIDSKLKNTEARHGKPGRITLSNKSRYNGTAPIDVSSGDQVRHRLSRSGNRRINHPLHMNGRHPVGFQNSATGPDLSF